jgi:hypothetical protein
LPAPQIGYDEGMTKLRTIEIDEQTADVLEARAAARGLSVAELVADLAWVDGPLPPDLQALHDRGEGPWSPEILAEDARRLAEFQRTREGVPFAEAEAWMESWGTPDERPAPKPRKL